MVCRICHHEYLCNSWNSFSGYQAQLITGEYRRHLLCMNVFYTTWQIYAKITSLWKQHLLQYIWSEISYVYLTLNCEGMFLKIKIVLKYIWLYITCVCLSLQQCGTTCQYPSTLEICPILATVPASERYGKIVLARQLRLGTKSLIHSDWLRNH